MPPPLVLVLLRRLNHRLPALFRSTSFFFVSILLMLSAPSMVDGASAQTTNTSSQPIPCTDPRRVCAAHLYYRMSSNESRADVAALLGVDPKEVLRDLRNEEEGGMFVRVRCACEEKERVYMYTMPNTTTRTRPAPSKEAYQGLAWDGGNNSSSSSSLTASAGDGSSNASYTVSFLCGCLPDDTGNFTSLLSYSLRPLDTLHSLASRFFSSISSISSLNNNITNHTPLFPNRIYFLPINITLLLQPPPPPPPPQGLTPLLAPADPSSSRGDKDDGLPLGMVVIIVVATGLLILAAVAVIIVARKFILSKRTADLENNSEATTKGVSNGWKWSLCGVSDLGLLRRCLHETTTSSSKAPATLSREMMNSSMGPEKPVVYAYEEILVATENFKESNVLGQGAFGTVYYGILRDQEVAIKRMKAAITKEFLAEMKVLCKFHHTNLNELYGYSSFSDDLFLVYEYAEHRALSDRLHEPISKGFPPLTWNARVQIALDTAKGLEYIHEHTKEHYVHRDVKSSNILLDADFRAKVADFGTAKLVEKTGGGDVSVTRIVGTFGYLAPEYSRDGIATSKSDVYAFGVVLFELITGKQAISKSRSSIPSTPERRSLVSIMLRALKDCPSVAHINGLREIIDPGLNDLFPQDCVYKMAKLGQQCVEEDPILRPDMKYAVFTLSQILLSSMEWEATVAGEQPNLRSIRAG